MVKVGDLIGISGYSRATYEARVKRIDGDMVVADWHNHSTGPYGHRDWTARQSEIVPGGYFYPIPRKPTIIITE